ncbi:MAG: type I-E CRISPR-associated protein Cse2/CasB [Anaerolineales bacterium]|nr:type I-E CRISPR-associated protein Cse2/CasB [Anaerolineales bacterium]
MSELQENIRDKQIKEFIANLAQLDDGERAKFKRNAGNSLTESHQVRLLFYQKVLPYGISSPWQEERYFLIATLYPFDKKLRDKNRQADTPTADEPDEGETAVSSSNFSLGTSCRHARSDQNQSGLDRRFARLLDADAQQMPFQLRQIIMRLTTDWVAIDWTQLTDDLLRWEHSNRYVQRNWARDYVASKPKNE